MWKKLLIISIYMLVISGCVEKDVSDNTQDNRPSIEEIQKEFELEYDYGQEEAVAVLVEDDKLWEEMNMQIAAYKNEHGYLDVWVVKGDCEELIPLKFYWGSYTFEYVLADLDDNGKTEMIGFFDWGSGIVRSQLFILNNKGEFEYVETAKEEQDFYLYSDIEYNSTKNVVRGNVSGYNTEMKFKRMRIYYSEGKFVCEHK